MNLDDLLKSIREEDDSKGAKIDTEKFLKRKTFTNPLKGQRYQAPELPSAPPVVAKPTVVKIDPEKIIPEPGLPNTRPVVVKPTVVKIDPKKIIPKDANVVGKELGDKIDELVQVIREDNKLEEKSQKEDKKQLEAKKKKDREDRIETKKETNIFIFDLKKSTGKVAGFFDKLKKFIKLSLLSGLINVLYNFFTDPKNREKIEVVQGFLKDWWPALAGAIAFVLTPFKRLILKTIKFLAGNTLKILKLFTTNPIFGIAVAFGVAGVMDYLKGENRKLKLRKEVTELMEKEGISETEARIRLREQKEREKEEIGFTANPFDERVQELRKEIDQLQNIDFEETRTEGFFPPKIVNRAPGFEGGGFAMGTDTVPAMLTPGEFIMSRGAVNMFGADTMMAMNKMGGGTNRPKYGKVRGYQGGGYVFAKKMIQEHEGSNIVDGMHQAYFDSEGKPTIGYGHLIIPGDGYSMQSRISQKEADKLFDKDFDKHLKIAKGIPGFDKAPPQQQAAAIDLTFNMGYWPTDFPNAAKAFAAGDFEKAANELRYKDAAAGDFTSSLWYKQVGPRRGIPIVSLMRGDGIGDSPHLKGFEKLLPVSKSVDMMNSDLKQSSTSSMSTAPGSLGPAFSDDASMEKLSKQQQLSDNLSSIRSKLSNPIDTFIRTPLRRAFPGTPNVPTETRNFVLPAVDSPKQNVSSSNQTNDVPTFSVVSGNKMRDLISKDLGIHDLAGVS